MRPFLLSLLAFAVLCLPGAADAAKPARFNQYVGFGDSTLDSGYFRYHTTGNRVNDAQIAMAVAMGAGGGFAGPGIMNSLFLANRFGLYGGPWGGGGFNFANGGAFTAPLSVSPNGPYINGVEAPTNVATNQQIMNYLASFGGANPHALYVIKSGDNDLNFLRFMPSAWVAANPMFLQNLAISQATSAVALQAAGARTIMVPNSYNYAVFAAPGGSLDPANSLYYARSVGYGMLRWSSMSQAGVKFIPADIDSLMKFVVRNPLLFGFTPSSVLSANAATQLSPLVTSWADVTPAQMQNGLFLNNVHLTTAGQQIEADYEYNLITAPVQMSLLAEGPVLGGLARAATIQRQIDLSGQNRGPSGVNIWASGSLSSLQIRNVPGFPDQSGLPLEGSVGADYQTPCGLLVGAAFTMGTQTQNWTRNGGHYDQTGQSLSLYTGYRYGPVWGNAVGSYGFYQDKITRNVPIGLFTDHNRGDTTGRSLALALRAGGDIPLGPVTTGPVAGLVLQQVRISGFTESGTSGVSALGYGEQLRDSCVGQIGWRAMVDISRWQPFAEATWNHEFNDVTSRKVKANLLTTSAPNYALDAAPGRQDWVSASVGTSFKVNERIKLKGTATADFETEQAVTYGGELGVNVNF